MAQDETQRHGDALQPPPIGQGGRELRAGSRDFAPMLTQHRWESISQAIIKRSQAFAEGISQGALGKPKSLASLRRVSHRSHCKFQPRHLRPRDDL